ncbi:MAG: hypothetical protein H6860_04540 [Rhodospirillales bacterium]|nr:hypothetical protein [Alphaproteobacteria bacterium]MCB9981649.1 hypothetical protein [Rhodospirillales bacterium]
MGAPDLANDFQVELRGFNNLLAWRRNHLTDTARLIQDELHAFYHADREQTEVSLSRWRGTGSLRFHFTEPQSVEKVETSLVTCVAFPYYSSRVQAPDMKPARSSELEGSRLPKTDDTIPAMVFTHSNEILPPHPDNFSG